MRSDAEPDPPDDDGGPGATEELEQWARRLLATCDAVTLLRCLAEVDPDPFARGPLVKVRTVRRVITMPGGRLVALEFPAIRRRRG
ncbi:hypothetical protein ABT369_47435 [Dactylosporangium sp. NPDC000244]|uniref:hypothetical protein n=1 Tax=Dactylosporangium sp. NPDC000244 TaxID=3154365 RepID=UPI003318BF8C